jgi:hypothetical protein
MTLEQLSTWLDAYGHAWERLDAEAAVALFDDSAVYQWGPFSAPLCGRDEIEARLREALASQEDVRFEHEPLALTPDGRGICRWWVSIRQRGSGEIEENEGIFLVTLGEDGRCLDFREWWNTRLAPADS